MIQGAVFAVTAVWHSQNRLSFLGCTSSEAGSTILFLLAHLYHGSWGPETKHVYNAKSRFKGIKYAVRRGGRSTTITLAKENLINHTHRLIDNA